MPPTDPEQRRARLELVAAGARLAAAGLLLPGEGNLSRRVGETAFVVTPRGVDKSRLAAADLIRVEVGAEDPEPGVSTEVRLHQAVYRRDNVARAVVHAHPPRTLALAVHGRLPEVDRLEEGELMLAGVVLVGFAPSGSPALAEAVAEALGAASACVIERHGAVTVGADLETALRRMMVLERLAELTLAGA